MSVAEPEFPSPATELDALVERIDELDEIDELVDWQLSRPQPFDPDELAEFIDRAVLVMRSDNCDNLDELDEALLSRTYDGGIDVHPAVLVVDAGQHVLISVTSAQSGTTTLALDHDDALRLAQFLMAAAALVPPTPRHVIEFTTGDEQTSDGDA